MLCAVDEDNHARLIDLVDHPELTPAGRVERLELTPERLAGSSRVLRDRAEDRLQDGTSDLLGEPVEMPEPLRRDLNLVGHLQVILQADPLAIGSFSA